MDRARLVAATVVAAALVLAAAACADDDDSTATLPPIVTTSSTTTTILVTTTVQRFYVIQAGDTLSKIAESFGVSQADLMAVNGIVDPDRIEAGEQLEIPTGPVVLTTLPSTTSTSSSVPGS